MTTVRGARWRGLAYRRSRSPAYEAARQLPVLVEREAVARSHNLDTDVVGTGVVVLKDPSGDRIGVSPRHHMVDEPVASAVG